MNPKPETKITIDGIPVNVIDKKGTNFGPRITPEEAARLLRLGETLPDGLPFAIRCKEYGHGMDGGDEPDPEDVEEGTAVDPEAWAEVYYEDWFNGPPHNDGNWPDDCKTFEIERHGGKS